MKTLRLRHLVPTTMLALLVTLLTACPGSTMGENEAGQDTWLEAGSIAVDPRTDVSFTLHTVKRTDDGVETTTKELYAIHPDWAAPRKVIDLSDLSDLRILFPKDRVLVMAEDSSGRDNIVALDPYSLSVVQSRQMEGRYWGTRMSPSGRYLVVADGNDAHSPIHVIETASLQTVVIGHGGDWLEAMWQDDRDVLVAIVQHGFDGCWSSESEETPEVRLLAWSFETQDESILARPTAEDGTWVTPIVDRVVERTCTEQLFNFSWVGIQPQGTQAVIPVSFLPTQDEEDLGETTRTSGLLILDVGSGEVRRHDHALGPVGFSPDGSTIVAYRSTAAEDRGAQLLLIDTLTLDEEVQELPYELPSFYVTRNDHVVVITPWIGDNGGVLLYDFDEGALTQLSGPTVHLHEFVARDGQGELWLVDNGLHRLDLVDSTLETLSPGWTPRHINRLPGADLLVMDDRDQPRIVFFDPSTERVVGSQVIVDEDDPPNS